MSTPTSSLLTSIPPAVLIDTSGFYTLMDESEDAHQDASNIFNMLSRSGTRLVTTDFIIAETHALIIVRLKRTDKALEFVNRIYSSSNIRIINITPSDQLKARAILNKYTDKAFSYTDATSFAVMERLNIRHTLTLDGNFRQYGFVMLPPE